MQLFNLLSEEQRFLLDAYLADLQFREHNIDEGVDISLAPIPNWLTYLLATEVAAEVGDELKLLTMFMRYNSPEVDTSFRVHSDGAILGEHADWACVYYLDDGETGTALFDHPEYGSFSRDGLIFTKDDGKWEAHQEFPQVANSMAIYRADSFHSRWPHQAVDDRFVIVGFFKEVG